VLCRQYQPQYDELARDTIVTPGEEYDTSYWSFALGHELLHAVGNNSEFSSSTQPVNSNLANFVECCTPAMKIFT
jgi:hypothetical protein